ncbi:mitochondrial half-size ABC transporter [Fistulina hepatica ATCC 64428]|uniref:Mitochondrial half-size ABC transporter n=1 Tax=Fistulina hepatica ATCC 64428 TaxID=1128425 RepID=A0A0D7A5L9_9AGAR|nr:mitochondrial half-size ABC transporter [Fistulina hepatica ATCC 64428]
MPTAIAVLRVLAPFAVLIAALAILPAQPAPPASAGEVIAVVVASRVPRRGLILFTLSAAAFTYLLDGLTLAVFAVIDKQWPKFTGIDIGSVLGLAGFAGLAALGAYKDVRGVDMWFLKRVKLCVATALAIDITTVVLLGIAFKSGSRQFPIPEISYLSHLGLLLPFIFPVIRVLFEVPLLAALLYPHIVYTPASVEEDVEVAPTSSSFLLPPGAVPVSGTFSPVSAANGEASKYGTFRPVRSTLQQSTPVTRSTSPVPSPSDGAKEAKPDVSYNPTWSEFWHRAKRITPYLWPSDSHALQFIAMLCVLILLLTRFVNAAMPFALGELVNILEGTSDRSMWLVLLVYVGLRFLQGSGGLPALRNWLWAPVMQYSARGMSLLSFSHILNLSFAFHTHRKTGEVLRVLDRGAAINNTLELVLFNIVPIFLDIIIALVVFCVKFEWTLTVVIFFVMFAYMSASVVMTQWRTKIRRMMNEKDIVCRGIHADCLLNYETVKYFGGEDHEAERYLDAMNQYQGLEYKVIVSLNVLNLVQNLIITLGLLIGSMIVALRVTRGLSTASDFVIFITYLAQLYGPLNQLGSTYRAINSSLVDTERLLNLLNEPTDVNDKPNAPDLIVEDGEIEFRNVKFSYDGRGTALNNVSFKVPRGAAVALVGESGSGKSTAMRLLYRFYDLKEGEGSILIDGKDIRDVTQKSLRQAIGVVPQDTVLFNASIRYNIGYGKFGATNEEIMLAAKSAQMHDRIMSFPDGDKRMTQERGVRLSGGEKQRVAIARTLLKNPPILLLDEATSALDTSTEKDIQKALQNLMQGRSSLSIAHRLSTIVSADLIVVLKNGEIVEQGSFKELVAHDGVFAAMWADQVTTSGEPPADDLAVKREEPGYIVDAEPVVSQSEQPASIKEAAAGISTDAFTPTTEGKVAADPVPAQAPSEPVVTTISDKDLPTLPAADSFTAPVTFPSPVAFPMTDEPEPIAVPPTAENAPISFPTSDGVRAASSSQHEPQSTQITFGDVNTPPRSGTPDPEAEPKRRRISSQNFQRLARRLSSARRPDSVASLIPGLRRNTVKRDRDAQNTSRMSVDESGGMTSASGEGSGSVKLTDSPTASVTGEGKSKKEKKEKRLKRKSMGPGASSS